YDFTEWYRSWISLNSQIDDRISDTPARGVSDDVVLIRLTRYLSKYNRLIAGRISLKTGTVNHQLMGSVVHVYPIGIKQNVACRGIGGNSYRSGKDCRARGNIWFLIRAIEFYRPVAEIPGVVRVILGTGKRRDD